MSSTRQYTEALDGARTGRRTVTARLWRDGDPATALQAAGIYLDAVGHIVVAWLWLDQLLRALADRDDAFADGKHAAACYFYCYGLPVALAALQTTAEPGRLLLDLDPASL